MPAICERPEPFRVKNYPSCPIRPQQGGRLARPHGPSSAVDGAVITTGGRRMRSRASILLFRFSAVVAVAGFGTDGDRGINTNAAQSWGCSPSTTNVCFYAGHIDVPVNKPSVRLESRCGSMSGCSTGAGTTADAYVSAWNIAVDVSDST